MAMPGALQEGIMGIDSFDGINICIRTVEYREEWEEEEKPRKVIPVKKWLENGKAKRIDRKD